MSTKSTPCPPSAASSGTNHPCISIVLPFFNADPTLASAIASIRAQTFEDWELLAVDDGSTDPSAAIAHAAAADDARIRVIAVPHNGIVSALQAGCAQARGEFIARMDADDVAHPNRLAHQVQLMRHDPSVMLCGTQVRMVAENDTPDATRPFHPSSFILHPSAVGLGRRRYQDWINGLLTHEAMVRELFVECPIPHPTFLMRRDAFESVGGYADRGWAEDYDLCMRFFLAGLRFGKAAAPLLDWRESAQRLSMSDPRYSLEQFRALKRHYLFESYLKGRARFYQWGAGEVGKPWLREWGDQKPLAVVDIDPRKIGRVIHGVRVIPPDDLPAPGECLVLIAVGAPNARDEIRAWLAPRNYRELDHFLFLA